MQLSPLQRLNFWGAGHDDWYCIDLDWIDKNIPEGNEKRKRLADAEQERDDCIEECAKSFPTLWEIMIKTLTGK